MPDQWIRDLDLFADQTISNGGTWYKLEELNGYCLCKSQMWYSDVRESYGCTPVFQVFDRDGKRICTTLSYQEALAVLRQRAKS